MASQGLEATKVVQITAAAGVGKGTFFTHWPSKDAFVASLVDTLLTDLARRVRPVGLAPTDAEALIADVGAVHLRFFQLRPEAAALLNQSLALATAGEAHALVAARLEEHLELVAEMIAPAGEQLGWPRERAKRAGPGPGGHGQRASSGWAGAAGPGGGHPLGAVGPPGPGPGPGAGPG